LSAGSTLSSSDRALIDEPYPFNFIEPLDFHMGQRGSDSILKWRATALKSVSTIRLLLPDPDTPETTVSASTGKWTAMFEKIVSCCAERVMKYEGDREERLFASRLLGLLSTFTPQVLCRTSISLHKFIDRAGKTISPPKCPPPGPSSTTQSLAAIISLSCSTTMIVFPRRPADTLCLQWPGVPR